MSYFQTGGYIFGFIRLNFFLTLQFLDSVCGLAYSTVIILGAYQ